MRAILVRLRQLSNSRQTCGRFILLDEKGSVVFQAASLELPWLNNKANVSCIPVGDYNVNKITSSKFGKGTFSLTNVLGRSAIRIHPGNYTRDIRGCILLGERFANIDNDGITDVVNSRNTIYSLKQLTDNFRLTII